MSKNKSNYHPYKKQNYNKSKNSYSGTLPLGVKGFLCTFNTMKKNGENLCMKEAFNILDEYLEKSNKDVEYSNIKTENVVSNSSELDIEDELKSELNELKNNDVKKHKFQKQDTGAQGNMFLKINDRSIDPVTLGTSIVEDLYETKKQKTVHLLRLIPVEVTCKSYIDDISKAIVPLLDKYFSGEPVTYCIVVNKRNNNNLDKMNVIEFVALLIKEKNMFHSVDLKQAALTVVVEIIKSVCCLSVLPHYYKYKKYNLCEITYPEDIKDDVSNEKDAKSESNTNEKEVKEELASTEDVNEEAVEEKRPNVENKDDIETKDIEDVSSSADTKETGDAETT